ncbi:oligosaccharide flippase family protein [Aurantiacibacter poecillastricola]|uniref:oligosaccharide flippase family protein n=1 Tax=Aurantiacibacter poecillastricola TaxID=3064385 RepID=UPI00273FC6A7|nr:oligosaccharide flippase family protein [Aurantiacibacter sp. 219JJ12-13]MDP5260013.1 oligosaccharide flippase family protein [Aurantiacibacter sp. 219JJ12-13]
MKPETSLPRTSIARRLAGGFAWSSLGTLGWRVLTAASSIIAARVLGVAGFGELGVVRSTANFFQTFAIFRLGTTASKSIAEHRGKDPARAGSVLSMVLVVSAALCAFFGLVLLLAGGWIARDMLDNPGLEWPLRISSVIMFFQAYGAVRETILIGTESFRSFAWVNAAKGGATSILLVIGALLGGVTGAVAGLALGTFVSFIVLEISVRRALASNGIPGNLPFSTWKKEIPILFSFALPGLVTGAATAGCYWIGRVHLSDAPGGFVQLGLFEAANQWRTMVLLVPGALALAALPIIADSYGKEEKGDFNEAIALQFNGILALALPISVGVIVFGDWLMALFGNDYAEAASVLPVLMISVFLFALNQSLRRIMDGTGHVWRHTAMTGAWAVAFLGSLFFLFEDASALSLAWAYMLAEAVMVAISIIYVVAVFARWFLVKTGLPLLLAAGAAALAVAGHAQGNLLMLAAALVTAMLPLGLFAWSARS